MAKLSSQQLRFASVYVETGNGAEAARQAGYKNPRIQASRLLTKDNIKKEVARRIKKKESEDKPWGRKELYEFWQTMAQEAEGDNNRLKASELLAKAEAMFVQRHEVEDVTKRPLKERMWGALQQILKDPEGRRMVKEAAENLE